MSIFKCKMCGGALEIGENQTVAVCEYCGTQQTLPKLDTDRRANLYDRANHFRRNDDFDKAADIYEQILNEDRTDAEAYWSLVLCRYGIEYVEDPATRKRVPTVNRAQFTSVFDDDNYICALRYADPFQRRLYKDEAQAIKNHNTQNARSVKAIRSAQRFALTGTPIENRLSELWSIFDFLMPGFLYTYSRFREKLEAPIVRGGDPAALERLNKMTAPFILRRLKREVLRELPPKIESVLTATMEDEQRQLYLANAAQARRELAQDPDGRNRMNLLALLTRLRQICCDPRLCYEDYGGGSCKLDACMELLREAAGTGHKVLLFSQFTSMLAILAKKLEEEGLSYYLLQGSTSKESRAAMVESFNRDDTQVFLISLKAGGAGLNLTGADLVILYDPWWNVSAQNQAADRAHRIGQTRSVQIIRLIARDTIEEKILLLQESKRELVDAVIREGNAPLSALSPEELLELLE